ncbi:MAG TPA: GNAT family N-acetyltransferase [Candidatus Nitrosotenuis sp.]|jgi:ribosomal protein S18 acetylase RimI-like enzyme|nr:GNAT family N-acetyltransferase [Candidatus Nitrosotenuis sp.]
MKDDIEVREARLADIAWVRSLAVRSAVYGIPHTRDISEREVQAQARKNLENLELTFNSRDFVLLVATRGSQRLGYLMLDLSHIEPSTGEREGLIYDLAVAPEHWGRFVVHRLVRRAAQITAQRGFKYLVGEVSTNNRRTLVQALRLGFEVERYQIVMRCTPEGPAPIEHRPAEANAHLQSRLKRRRRSSQSSRGGGGESV